MFLQLAHTKLDVYGASKALALECYRVTNKFPTEEKFSMIQQIRRAALSVHLNLAEGSSRKSIAERSRFYEISRSSVVEVDTCLDLAVELKYITKENLAPVGESIIKTFKRLTGMIKP